MEKLMFLRKITYLKYFGNRLVKNFDYFDFRLELKRFKKKLEVTSLLLHTFPKFLKAPYNNF
jgi:hypothetical protein